MIMIILPKTIITVDALTFNTMYIVYRSVNGNINMIVNHYEKSGAKKEEFDYKMKSISKLIQSVKRIYPEFTPGDFDVRAKGTRNNQLLDAMSDNYISIPFKIRTNVYMVPTRRTREHKQTNNN